jgi:hypothetical protein
VNACGRRTRRSDDGWLPCASRQGEALEGISGEKNRNRRCKETVLLNLEPTGGLEPPAFSLPRMGSSLHRGTRFRMPSARPVLTRASSGLKVAHGRELPNASAVTTQPRCCLGSRTTTRVGVLKLCGRAFPYGRLRISVSAAGRRSRSGRAWPARSASSCSRSRDLDRPPHAAGPGLAVASQDRVRPQSLEPPQRLDCLDSALVDEVGWHGGASASGQKVDRAQCVTGEDDATLLEVECTGA